MTKNRYEAVIDAIILREEKRIAARKVDQQANRVAWNLTQKGKVCPANSHQTFCISLDCPGKICVQFVKIGLDANGQPLRKRSRPTCGAKTRKGTPCQMRVEVGKRRCKLHGGLSTGPKTKEGRERIASGQKRRWEAWRIKHNIV